MAQEIIMTAEELRESYGGQWAEGHPVYTVDAWKSDVADENTRNGYWEWLASCLEFDPEFDPENHMK